MDQSLQDAAIRGDVRQLHHILSRDQFALDRIQLGGLVHSPLHIASFRGHTPFVTHILYVSPGLALVLDHRRWSPLHMAVSGEHREIVKALAEKKPEMCMVVDGDGNNPLHFAAIKGWLMGLTVLVEIQPHAAFEMTATGESILHLCVKYNHLNCLQFLLYKFGYPEFINVKDSRGNTILHQAVRFKLMEIIEYLSRSTSTMGIDIDATNAMGHTAIGILSQRKRHMNVDDIKIRDTLLQAGASRNMFGKIDWLPKRRDPLMVVASLIATMAFTAGLNPPGGVWQDTREDVRAGDAIIAYKFKDSYKMYLLVNTIAFISSLSVILFLISGLPLKRRKFMWVLQVVMWVTITAVAFTYSFALVALTPIKSRASVRQTLTGAIISWWIMMALVLLGNAIRLVMEWVTGTSKEYLEKGKDYLEKIHRDRIQTRLDQWRSMG